MSTETLRPNAAGDEENVDSEAGNGAGDHHELVDEAVADDFTTYIYHTGTGSFGRDLYNLADSGVGAGTINHITVYARCIRGSKEGLAKIAIKSGTGAGNPDTVDEGAEFDPTASWTENSKQWTTNPATSAAWAWAEIDKLQAGIALKKVDSSPTCTQLWVVVDYTEAAAAAELGAFYQQLNPLGIHIYSAGQVRGG